MSIETAAAALLSFGGAALDRWADEKQRVGSSSFEKVTGEAPAGELCWRFRELSESEQRGRAEQVASLVGRALQVAGLCAALQLLSRSGVELRRAHFVACPLIGALVVAEQGAQLVAGHRFKGVSRAGDLFCQRFLPLVTAAVFAGSGLIGRSVRPLMFGAFAAFPALVPRNSPKETGDVRLARGIVDMQRIRERGADPQEAHRELRALAASMEADGLFANRSDFKMRVEHFGRIACSEVQARLIRERLQDLEERMHTLCDQLDGERALQELTDLATCAEALQKEAKQLPRELRALMDDPEWLFPDDHIYELAAHATDPLKTFSEAVSDVHQLAHGERFAEQIEQKLDRQLLTPLESRVRALRAAALDPCRWAEIEQFMERENPSAMIAQLPKSDRIKSLALDLREVTVEWGLILDGERVAVPVGTILESIWVYRFNHATRVGSLESERDHLHEILSQWKSADLIDQRIEGSLREKLLSV